MKRIILGALCVAGLYAGSGCAIVTSSMPSLINVTGEAWYTEAIGFAGITWGSKVWYCPPASAGPLTCKEARLVPLTKEELEQQKLAEKGGKK